ncbi:B12-binding domain-containing radical SAM protein, partial [Myxococcota bacterium]|nr:B12-binding domain-containing radical SAM protein [Myxococcota bacterium]
VLPDPTIWGSPPSSTAADPPAILPTMRVLMTMAPCRRLQFNLSDLYPVPRLGIAGCAARLRERGHAVRLVDLIAERWWVPDLLSHLESEPVDLFGVSATILSLKEAFELCDAVRSRFPSVRTAVGGPGLGGFPPEVLFRYGRGVDFFVHGEGEDTFAELADVLGGGGSPAQVAGISWRDGEAAVRNADRPMMNGESIPDPAFDLLPMDRYRLHPPMGVWPYATLVETARGCTYSCDFCCLSMKWRARPVEAVLAQLRWLRERYGIREVHFIDPTFTLNTRRAVALSEGIARLPFRLAWSCKTRVDLADRDTLAAMRRSGCYLVAFGVESGSDEQLDRLDKGLAREHSIQAFRDCRDLGIRTTAYLLVGSPGESDATVDANIRFTRELQPDYVLYDILEPIPGTPITQEGVRQGWFTEEDVYAYYLDPGNSRLDERTVTGVPVATARRWIERASRDFYLRPRYFWERVRDLRTLQDARNLGSGGAAFLSDLTRRGHLWKMGATPRGT